MRLATTIISISILLAGAAAGSAQMPAQAEKLLESARHKEVMEGDLKAAIEQYRKIAVRFAQHPDIAARALFQMGQCQEKLGRAEARKSYERIVREYGGAQQYASAARARLAALGEGSGDGRQMARAVWTGPKVTSETGLSRDGHLISYPDWDTGHLGLHDLVTGSSRLLTTGGSFLPKTGAFAEGSAISRDGRQVAYAWYDSKLDRYELRVLSLNGDARPRRVFENQNATFIWPRDWTPDGKAVVAELWKDQKSQIGLINVEDGSLRVLRTGKENPQAGFLSPDGRYLLYTRSVTGGVSRGYLGPVDSSVETPLVEGPASVETPVWTPDGSRVFFVSDRSGSRALWSVGVAGGKPAGEPELLKAGFDNTLLGFGRDGSLFYELDLQLNDIYRAGLDPATGKLISEPTRVNQRAVGNSWGRIAWLPDGKALSFWNTQPVPALVVHTLATGQEHEVWGGKSGRPGTGYAGWFPDGRTVLGIKVRSDPQEFRRVDSVTGESLATWTIPALSPDAMYIGASPDLMTMFFLRKDPAVPCQYNQCASIVVARGLANRDDREVLRVHAAFSWRMALSKDGGELTWVMNSDSGQVVLAAPIPAGQPRELHRFPGNDDYFVTGLAWTPDKRHVLVFRRKRSGGEVWAIPTQGGSPVRSPIALKPSEPPAVSPDGTQVAFVARENKTEIWTLTGIWPRRNSSRD